MTTLAERLAVALVSEAETALIEGDDGDLSGGHTLTEAAVLVAVTDRARPGVLLTQRTETLRRHAGQVAFPGGRLDPGEDAIAAALREAEEEIALPRDAVEVVGASDVYRTGTGFRVTPIIGVVPPDLPLVPSEAEVADLFEVPLDFLLDAAHHQPRRATWQGRERAYFELLWGERRIWGATAGMIVNLSRRLRWST
ncbi:CoA pyrophosphatase [Sphingomonas sp. BK235]|uniref:CoA pyrophosphatase n=1 Tax=Sphingomonas sp. BK235 TaxID=2512131 RepID=UPI00104D685E|nr:CoA pyrophosphatase [Sphingomonas sp. BK235]TCP36801.1 NUDIX domain-containing protein [Sphingomonas sp. BK235]